MRGSRDSSWWYAVGSGAMGVFLVALIVLITLRMTADGLSQGDQIASIASTFIGIASLAVGVVGVVQGARQRHPPQSSPSAEALMGQQLQDLLRRAGNLTTRGLEAELRQQRPDLARARSGVGAVLRGKQRPTWDLTTAIVSICTARAERLEIALLPQDQDLQRWHSLYDELFTDDRPGHRPRLVVGVAVLAALVVVPIGVAMINAGAGDGDLRPLTTSAVEVVETCYGGWLVTGPVTSVPALPQGDREKWVSWASAAEALKADATRVQFTVRGTSDAAVILTGVRVRVLQRSTAPSGVFARRACGGQDVFRWLTVDLDEDPPQTTTDYRPEFAVENGPPESREPIRFPYQVSIGDPETFDVFAWAHRCDCRWQIELLWNSGERHGVHIVEADGNPSQFRTVGTINAATECVDTFDNCHP